MFVLKIFLIHEIILMICVKNVILIPADDKRENIRRDTMSVCYDKLWKMLIDRKINRTELKDMAGISFNVLAKMRKGDAVSLKSLHKICKSSNCDIGDVMEFANDER